MLHIVSREDFDETALVHSPMLAFAGHICLVFVYMRAGKALTRLHLWLFANARFFVYVSREDFGVTVLVHSLI